MTKEHVNLLIATPGYAITTPYIKSLLSTMPVLSEKGITWAWISEYSSHVGDARESTLNGGSKHDPLETRPLRGDVTYDKILWIDSDISWQPEDVLRLYESDYEIISGAYMYGNGQSVVAHKEIFREPLSAQEVAKTKEPIEVAAVGMGFLMIKNGIFEQLSRPWFQSAYQEIQIEDKTINLSILGEDLSFCKRVSDLGYKIWLDPMVRLNHYKTVALGWEGLSNE